MGSFRKFQTNATDGSLSISPTGELFFWSAGGLFSITQAEKQHDTDRHLEYLIAPNTPSTRVVAPPMMARMSAVDVITFPIFIKGPTIKNEAS
jgi:hypothetical protein